MLPADGGSALTVERLRRGEPDVLAELLEQYGREIQGVAYLILRNGADAEDVLMDTLLAALDRGSTLRDATAMRRWLLKIATNLALGRQRRFGRVTWLRVAPEAPGPTVDTTEHVALLQGLATLPLRSRAAVVLHYYADLPVADVAAVMGTSQNTVKTQLRTGLARLRDALDSSVLPTTHAEATHG
jgi:RNA polymerase sigma-70 factor (ECF subfamily)